MSNAFQEQAQSNLAAIGSGAMSSTDSLAQLAPIFHQLKQTIPQLPQIPGTGKTPGAPVGQLPAGFEAGSLANATPLDKAAVKLAAKYLGVKYSWGGGSLSGPTKGIAQGANTVGFDCSGLVQSVWGQLGVKIPRTTFDQWKTGKAVSGPLRAGDAVFFRGSDGTASSPGHVGLYIGNGKMIVAPHTGSVVQIQSVAGEGDYMGARRF